MAKLILCAALTMVLTACGGGADEQEAPNVPPASIPGCTPRVVTVALLGDSTQYGFDSATKLQAIHNPGVELQADMNTRFGAGAVIVNNLAVGGTDATQAPRPQADVIVANFGVNDSARGESIEAYTAAMKATGATLIETQNPVIGLWDRDAPYIAAARGMGLPVADVNAYLNDRPASEWWPRMIDGIHPIDSLYVEIVDNVLAPAVAAQVAPLRCVAG